MYYIVFYFLFSIKEPVQRVTAYGDSWVFTTPMWIIFRPAVVKIISVRDFQPFFWNEKIRSIAVFISDMVIKIDKYAFINRRVQNNRGYCKLSFKAESHFCGLIVLKRFLF